MTLVIPFCSYRHIKDWKGEVEGHIFPSTCAHPPTHPPNYPSQVHFPSSSFLGLVMIPIPPSSALPSSSGNYDIIRWNWWTPLERISIGPCQTAHPSPTCCKERRVFGRAKYIGIQWPCKDVADSCEGHGGGTSDPTYSRLLDSRNKE